jgi:hypothetical protein
VYLAEQQEPVWRPVALKVIKLGMDTRQVVARFEAERQELATVGIRHNFFVTFQGIWVWKREERVRLNEPLATSRAALY